MTQHNHGFILMFLIIFFLLRLVIALKHMCNLKIKRDSGLQVVFQACVYDFMGAVKSLYTFSYSESLAFFCSERDCFDAVFKIIHHNLPENELYSDLFILSSK